MTTASPILTPLELVEDAIVAALQTLVPLSAWAPPIGAAFTALPAETVRALLLYATQPSHDDAMPYALLAQHQDGGGAPASHVNSAGWQGLVVVKALSATDAQARVGYAAAAALMASLTSPSGYRLAATWDRAIAIPPLDGIYQRAGQWRVTLRRTA